MAEDCDSVGVERAAPGKVVRASDLRARMDTYREYGNVNVGVSCGLDGLEKNWRSAKGMMHIIVGIPSHGKALDVRTPILTTDGWKKMGDIEVGDVV